MASGIITPDRFSSYVTESKIYPNKIELLIYQKGHYTCQWLGCLGSYFRRPMGQKKIFNKLEHRMRCSKRMNVSTSTEPYTHDSIQQEKFKLKIHKKKILTVSMHNLLSVFGFLLQSNTRGRASSRAHADIMPENFVIVQVI